MNEQSETFEKNMKRLEEIVRLLERGDAPLEESLSLFEEGTGLVRQCTTMLDAAEQKVTLLTVGEDGMPVRTPFSTDWEEAI